MIKKIKNNANPEYRFGKQSKLSNYYPCKVRVNGGTFMSSETAYHSYKFPDYPDIQLKLMLMGADESKQFVKTIRDKIRPDWEDVKIEAMYQVCMAKFLQNADCADTLLQTANKIIIENTTGWCDNTWGWCECPNCIDKEHKNYLGLVLMKVREYLQNRQ